MERVQPDGTVVLQGGLVNGLTEGSELRLLGPGPEVRIVVTRMQGLSRCEGRVQGPPSAALAPGALAEVVQWTTLPGAPLRVWMAGTADVGPAEALARELARQAPRQGIRWIEDPTRETPTHVLRWHGQAWELLAGEKVEPLGGAADATSILARIQGKSPRALFVQLPAPDALVRGITLGSGTRHAGVEAASRPEEADYVLTGRLAGAGLDYAWLRPGAGEEDRRRTSLPVRTAWHPLGERDGPSGGFRKAGRALEEAVLRLRRIHAWLSLETPSGAASLYELVLRRQSDGELVQDGVLVGQEDYRLVLRARQVQLPRQVDPRYFYVFVIDSFGKTILLFPTRPADAVANRLPLSPGAPAEISLGPAGVFTVTPPYGVDTYFLLASEERIPNPRVVETEGVQVRGPVGRTPLEELLSITGGAMRSVARLHSPAVWSVERKRFESVPPSGPARRARREP